jgi:hypothetical protein
MSTHTAISYHIVFSTKNRTPVLTRERRDDLFRYLWGIITVLPFGQLRTAPWSSAPKLPFGAHNCATNRRLRYLAVLE